MKTKMKKCGLALTTVFMFLIIAFAACDFGSPSVDRISQKLKDNGYFIVNTIEAGDYGVGLQLKMDGIKTQLSAVKTVPASSILISWYTNHDKAQEAYKAAGGHDGSTTVYIEGNMVATGSQDAIEIIKS